MASISTINGYTIDAGKFFGLDTSRVIASGSTTVTYTATEDCFFCHRAEGFSAYPMSLNVDGKRVYTNNWCNDSGTIWTSVMTPLKKGQQVSIGGRNSSYTVYGVK